jgi:3-methyladenine DNA glycosylase AlkC
LLFAGSSLDKVKRVFDRWANHRPRIRMTIRQRMRRRIERGKEIRLITAAQD